MLLGPGLDYLRVASRVRSLLPQQRDHAPQLVIQRVLIKSGPRHGSTLATLGPSTHTSRA
jgi:hypothetical protein